MNAITELRLRLRHAGYEPLPLLGKVPRFDNWQTLAQNATDHAIINWETTFPAFENTGGLTRMMPTPDIDLMNEDAAEDIENMVKDRFGDRGEILTRIGMAPKRAILLQTDIPIKKMEQVFALKFTKAKPEKIEILGNGQQVVLFGVHPDTHANYRWVGDRSPRDIARRYLPRVTEAELAAFLADATGLLVTQHGYVLPPVRDGSQGGDRQWSKKYWDDLIETIATGGSGLHADVRDLTAKLAARGWSREDIEDFVYAHMDRTTGPRDNRWATYRSDVGRAIAGAFAKGFGKKFADKNAAGAGGFTWDCPDESLLVDLRGPLPELPLDLLPPRFADWCTQAATATSTTPAHVAAGSLGIASGVIGCARVVSATREFKQPCTMWTMLTGPPASKKTWALQASKAALDGLAKELAVENEAAKKKHAEQVAVAEARLSAWKLAVKAADKKGDPEPPIPEGAIAPAAFIPTVIYSTDTTIERLVDLFAKRPQGLMLVMDELHGLFANLGRYNKGSDAEFWLASHNGIGHPRNRVGRGDQFVERMVVGVVGGIQPDLLASAFGGPHNGFPARFLHVYPATPPYRPLADIASNHTIVFRRALSRLARLTMAQDGDDLVPVELPLSAHARAELEHLRKDQNKGQLLLSTYEREWFGKADMHALRLAGTLAYIDWAMSDAPVARFRVYGEPDPLPPEPEELTGEQMAFAVRLVTNFFWPHARAVLRHITTTEAADIRIVLRWLAGELRAGRGVVPQREIQRDVLSERLDSDALTELLTKLADAGWIRRYVPPPNPQGGRPVLQWEANPKLGGIK
jgi:Protein of unknown function (DUF3987)